MIESFIVFKAPIENFGRLRADNRMRWIVSAAADAVCSDHTVSANARSWQDGCTRSDPRSPAYCNRLAAAVWLLHDRNVGVPKAVIVVADKDALRHKDIVLKRDG